MGTKKISQLEEVTDANLSGEAILPVVISDPLIPNRKARVSQLFRGVAGGTKASPGLAFDLDRNTGLYQNQYDEIGIAFGSGGFYFSRILNADNTTTQVLTATDSIAANSNITISPKGSGYVSITGNLYVDDGDFIIQDDSSTPPRRARFEVGNIGSGGNVKTYSLPTTTDGTILVGDDTIQEITNKTIRIEEDQLILLDGLKEASFGINWQSTPSGLKTYFLPDPGAAITSSDILDNITPQNIQNKTYISPLIAPGTESTYKVTLRASAGGDNGLTANHIIDLPNLSGTLATIDATQTFTNKVYQDLIIADNTDITKKVQFNLDNVTSATTVQYGFPENDDLNTESTDTNILVTDLSTQDLTNKRINRPVLIDDLDVNNRIVTLSLDNITSSRTIRFPDADATLLSTENVAADEVTFGGPISGQTLGGRTRLQQHFISGWS